LKLLSPSISAIYNIFGIFLEILKNTQWLCVFFKMYRNSLGFCKSFAHLVAPCGRFSNVTCGSKVRRAKRHFAKSFAKS